MLHGDRRQRIRGRGQQARGRDRRFDIAQPDVAAQLLIAEHVGIEVELGVQRRSVSLTLRISEREPATFAPPIVQSPKLFTQLQPRSSAAMNFSMSGTTQEFTDPAGRSRPSPQPGQHFAHRREIRHRRREVREVERVRSVQFCANTRCV